MKKTKPQKNKREKFKLPQGQAQTQKEKARARELRQSAWWKNKIAAEICHYCGGKFDKAELTMDHIVPMSRGGKSTKGNVVVSCKKCNSSKKYYTPAEIILRDQMNKDISF